MRRTTRGTKQWDSNRPAVTPDSETLLTKVKEQNRKDPAVGVRWFFHFAARSALSTFDEGLHKGFHFAARSGLSTFDEVLWATPDGRKQGLPLFREVCIVCRGVPPIFASKGYPCSVRFVLCIEDYPRFSEARAILVP